MAECPHTPSLEDSRRIARDFAGESVVELDRYPTGLCHWVYRCETASGRVFVLRVARPDNRDYIAGGITNGSWLAEQGVPVARVIGGDTEADLPWMAVEHLDGRDLGEVYADLSRPQKTALAREIVKIQQNVAELGEGEGFGYTHVAGELASFDRWDDVVDGIVQRSLGWLADTGLDADEEVELVRRRLDELRPALRDIRPVPFLDDLTTKNVLVHQGRLSGIVDVDELCYGDRMLWVGLTRMALLNAGHDVEYVENLLDELGANGEDPARCDFYTGLYAFVFLSEQGVAFNGDGEAPDLDGVAFLRKAVQEWVK
jgi:aminoglycoside phosphotransferase